MNPREEHRSLYLSYLECCNEHDVDRMGKAVPKSRDVCSFLLLQK